MRIGIAHGIALAALLLPVAPASAETIPVTTSADPAGGSCATDPCSLRRAIAAANSDGDHDTIAIPAGTYPLALGELVVTAPATLDGAGPAATTIDGAGLSRVLQVGPVAATVQELAIVNGVATVAVGPATAQGGGILNGGDLTLAAVSLRDNRAEKPAGENLNAAGGAIFNDGTLRVLDCEIRGNTATTAPGAGGIASGGGIASAGSSVEITNSTIAENRATVLSGIAGGGGILTTTSGEPAQLTVTGSTITANVAEVETTGGIAEGGGISTRDTGTSLATSTIADNAATGGTISEGAGALFRGSGDFLLDRSTVSGNDGTSDAIAGGAGLMLRNETDGASARIVNSTVEGNSNSARAFAGAAGVSSVGYSTTAIVNSTLAGNSASVSEDTGSATGNLESSGSFGGTVVLTASIIARGSGSPGVGNCSGEGIVSAGYNVESGDGCGLRAAGDRVNADPLLGPLGDNGGLTRTMALPAASPAIDAGGPACPAVDQRGVARPPGACDAGAFELLLPPPPPSVVPGGSPLVKLARKARVSPRNGKGRLRATCANVATDVCAVRFSLAVIAPRRRRSARHSRTFAGRLVRIGKVSGTLRGGTAGQLRIKLNRKGKARLRKRRKRPLSVRVSGRSSSSAGVALRFEARVKLLAKRSRGKRARR